LNKLAVFIVDSAGKLSTAHTIILQRSVLITRSQRWERTKQVFHSTVPLHHSPHPKEVN
jgi:hypothetical protein